MGRGDGAVGDASQRRRYGGLRPASPVSGEGYSKRSACGRSSALTRRGAVLLHARVNCAPAKGRVWPVLAPAQAWVRAGDGGRENSECEIGWGWGWRRGSVAAFCHRLMAGFAFLSPRFASAHVRLCVPVAALCLGSRLSFSSLRKKRRLAVCSVSVPPGRDRHSRVLQCRRGYLPWQVHFGFGRFFMAIPTG